MILPFLRSVDGVTVRIGAFQALVLALTPVDANFALLVYIPSKLFVNLYFIKNVHITNNLSTTTKNFKKLRLCF